MSSVTDRTPATKLDPYVTELIACLRRIAPSAMSGPCGDDDATLWTYGMLHRALDIIQPDAEAVLRKRGLL